MRRASCRGDVRGEAPSLQSENRTGAKRAHGDGTSTPHTANSKRALRRAAQPYLGGGNLLAFFALIAQVLGTFGWIAGSTDGCRCWIPARRGAESRLGGGCYGISSFRDRRGAGSTGLAPARSSRTCWVWREIRQAGQVQNYPRVTGAGLREPCQSSLPAQHVACGNPGDP
jgi:hypothetical protein